MSKETRAVVRTLNRLADTQDAQGATHITVVANGSPAGTLAEIKTLRERLPDLEVLTLPTALDRAAAFWRAIERSEAPVLVSLLPGVEPQPGWLAPLVRALDDPGTLGAAPVLRALDGTLVSAGPAFPAGSAPTPFLAGFPLEDAALLAETSLSAVSGPAVAFRRVDLAAVGGPGPETGDALCWADVSLRLSATRPGRFVTCLDSSVVVRRPIAPTPEERDAFSARWPAGPGDDRDLWRRAGFEVTGYEADGAANLRRLPVAVREGVPCLRWAIKNPATALGWGELWGDTHFCRRLAEALRRLGQTVAVDHRGAFDRATGRFDDVTLVVRGLTPHTPTPDAVNLAWLISHPELMEASEAAGYDRVFAAGPAWAERKSQEWGLRIDPLPQATDPALFHPDCATPDTGHAVLFVGSARDGQREIVQLAVAAGLPVTAYGTGWENQLPAAQVAGAYLPNDELGAAYRAAGVVLNDHWADMRAGGFLSNRLFDAAAAGARVITDDVPYPGGLDVLFGRSVQVARTAGDLQRLATAHDAFGDDAERRAVATRVRAEHSFDARARVLLDAALELRPTR
ncbi:MAG TPA: glycosyltransferase [Sporichthya sp.]|nr:glycosyltransferase [Sporichthya sp.]